MSNTSPISAGWWVNPRPTGADREGLDYAFQKQVTKTAGTRGFADVWKRGHFAMEYKGRGANFNAAFDQTTTGRRR